MPVFYRGPGAVITHKVIEVPWLCRRTFALDDLDWVQATREGPDPETSRTRAFGASVMASVLVTVPMVSRASVVLAVVVGAASLVSAGACLRVRPVVHYQLRAQCRGEVVTLLDTVDRAEFYQVCRALRRAEEFRDDTRCGNVPPKTIFDV